MEEAKSWTNEDQLKTKLSFTEIFSMVLFERYSSWNNRLLQDRKESSTYCMIGESNFTLLTHAWLFKTCLKLRRCQIWPRVLYEGRLCFHSCLSVMFSLLTVCLRGLPEVWGSRHQEVPARKEGSAPVDLDPTRQPLAVGTPWNVNRRLFCLKCFFRYNPYRYITFWWNSLLFVSWIIIFSRLDRKSVLFKLIHMFTKTI